MSTATTAQIHTLYFSGISKRYCQKRLEYLHKEKFIKRTKSTINNDYAYYVDKKSYLPQIHHDLIKTQLYTELKLLHPDIEWYNEVPIENIRPDALCFVKHHGIEFTLLVEVHLNNNFNFDKYKFDLKALFKNPRVIICTDRSVTLPQAGVRFKLIGLDMSGLENLFK